MGSSGFFDIGLLYLSRLCRYSSVSEIIKHHVEFYDPTYPRSWTRFVLIGGTHNNSYMSLWVGESTESESAIDFDRTPQCRIIGRDFSHSKLNSLSWPAFLAISDFFSAPSDVSLNHLTSLRRSHIHNTTNPNPNPKEWVCTWMRRRPRRWL
jgi:hypothetical protein